MTLDALKRLLRRDRRMMLAASTIVRHYRRLRSLPTRSRSINAYLASHPIRKLQLGTGRNVLAGWLNTDIEPKGGQLILVDAGRRLPFADHTFDYILSEHLIEHLAYPAGLRLLHECYRVLRPEGKIRIATPDLEAFVGLYTPALNAIQTSYVRFIVNEYLPDISIYNPCFVLNNAFYNFGHRFLYDRVTLRHAMERAGFVEITLYRPGESDDEAFRGVESHGRVIGAEDFNQFETFVLEGTRPA
jgi:SAM-dependent methyltransferase